jgi:hypothetical protein
MTNGVASSGSLRRRDRLLLIQHAGGSRPGARSTGGVGPYPAQVVRTVMTVVGASTVLVVAVAVVFLFQEQRQQAQQLARLQACLATLERNQGTPPGEPIAGCPIYN